MTGITTNTILPTSTQDSTLVRPGIDVQIVAKPLIYTLLVVVGVTMSSIATDKSCTAALTLREETLLWIIVTC